MNHRKWLLKDAQFFSKAMLGHALRAKQLPGSNQVNPLAAKPAHSFKGEIFREGRADMRHRFNSITNRNGLENVEMKGRSTTSEKLSSLSYE